MFDSTHSITPFFEHLEAVLRWRLQYPEGDFEASAPKLILETVKVTPLGVFMIENQLSQAEIIILLLAVSTHIKPTLLYDIGKQCQDFRFHSYAKKRGGQKNADPTGETVVYLLSGNNVNKRIASLRLFEDSRFLIKEHIVYLGAVEKGTPVTQGMLLLYEEAFQQLIYNADYKPRLSEEFPAREISTPLAWDDLILQEHTLKQIQQIQTWLIHNDALLYQFGMAKRLKPGYRVLFYGPPGTGKTLAASLLGKYTGKAVYRVDLSVLVSKYIGETEKHLANLFNKAEKQNWILFFDEADSIFGKRTNVRDSHDKYANQEVSYLLQKIEAYPGMVILASNYKDNIDSAFMRRFQSIIHFHLPDAPERYRMWKHNLPDKLPLAADISLDDVAQRFELNGSNIMNCIQDVCLKALASEEQRITKPLLIESIKKEYLKEDKIF